MGYLLTIFCRVFETLTLSAGSHMALSSAGIFFMGFPVAFSASAYAMVILQKADIPLAYATAAGIGMALLLGLGFAYAYTKMSNDSYAVLTLSSLLAFDALVSSWDSVTGGVLGISGVVRPGFLSSLGALAIGQALLAFAVVGLEWIILSSAFGRSLRALKESPETLASLGTSSDKVGSTVIVLASLLAALSGIVGIWRIQFLDPSFGGVAILLQALTVAVLAYKPQAKALVWSSLLAVLLPEALRFFPFPSSALGSLRMLVYSLLVVVLIKNLARKSFHVERSV